jgi:hypothetical protein
MLALHRPQTAKHCIPVVSTRTDPITGKIVEWREANMPALEAEHWFPQFIRDFERDSYFGINGVYTPIGAKSGKPSMSRHLRGLPARSRNGKHLHALCSTFADLDTYTKGITVGQAVGALIDLERSDRIPRMSMLTLSGRGVWVHWFLRDDNGSGPPAAWPEKVRLWSAIQHAICKRMLPLGCDVNALDAPRVMRIPGSINSKSGERVQHYIAADERGALVLHTLEELARGFNVCEARWGSKVRRSISSTPPHKHIEGQRGQVSRFYRCVRAISLVSTLRGRFQVGTRHACIWLYAAALVRVVRGATKLRDLGESVPPEWSDLAGMTEEQIRSEVLRFAANECAQPAGDEVAQEVVQAITGKAIGARGLTQMRNQTVANYLRLTPAEAQHLKAHGMDYPPSEEHVVESGVHGASPDRNTRAHLRRDMIANLVRALGGSVPPAWKINQHLDPAGMAASDATIQKDLVALGLVNPRSHVARRAKRKREDAPLFNGSKLEPTPIESEPPTPEPVPIAVEPAPPEQTPSEAAAPMSDVEWRRAALARFFRGAVPAGTGSEPGPELSGTNEAHKAGPEAASG